MSRLRLRFYNAIDRLLTFARHCHFSSWWFCVCGWAEFWGKLKDAIVKEKPRKIERERDARAWQGSNDPLLFLTLLIRVHKK